MMARAEVPRPEPSSTYEEVHVSHVASHRYRRHLDKADWARFKALAMLAGASAFILAIIMT